MKILKDSQGNVLIKGGNALAVKGTSPDQEYPHYTGTVDVEGLTALGWDAEDIAWLQAHVWWNAEDNEYWKVTEANLAFGPNGATPLTWADRATVKNNPDVRYFPKFNPSPSSNTSWNALMSSFTFVYAIPTHGWDTTNVISLSSLFASCSNLRSAGDWSQMNTAKSGSFQSMCSYCYHLSSLGDLSGWKTGAANSFSAMFLACNMLCEVGDLSGWQTENIVTFANMFNGCQLLESVGDLSEWDTSKVTNMQSMFSNCNSLNSIGDLSHWDVSKVTLFSSFMGGCYRITRVGDLSNWDTKEVTSMSSFFSSCYSLVSIGDISKWNTSKVTTTSGMFSNCVHISGLGDFSNWDMSSNANMSTMFQNCRFLSKIKIKDWDVSDMENISSAFSSCLFEEIDLSNWDLGSCTNAGTAATNSAFTYLYSTKILKLGPHFFDGTPTTYYMTHMYSWSRDSIYESLYTNQTLRNSQSTAITVKLHATAYDKLSAQDRDDIATKNITLTRG